uniref:t-SNARE coiled-coil homology domain-containing protein n=1 Tax=Hanusia phi TaxID=3032 RepID=A0A7S0NDW1_9CRYP
MSDEIEQLDVELNELLSSVRNDIEGLEWDAKKVAMTSTEKKEEILRLKNQLDKAKGIFQNYKVEMRELDRDELRKYEGSARKHQSTLDELNRNLNYAKSLVEKAELMGDRDQNPTSAADGKNAKELIEMAKQTQVTDVEAMMRMQRMINESEETGMETNIKLKTQTEQLKNIHADVHTVSARMRTAEKLVNQIGRRLATDKLIACIILILLLLILAIIVVKALGLDQKGTAQVVGAGGYVYYIDCNLFQNFYPQCQSTPAPSPGPTPAPSGGNRRKQLLLQLADKLFKEKLDADSHAD